MILSEIFPHKYPFLFIDKVLEIEEGRRVVCLKNITINEDFFDEHFKENPIVPNFLLIEVMAQTAGLLVSSGAQELPNYAFLVGIKDAKFKRHITVGEQLVVTALSMHKLASFYVMNVSIAVNGDTVAESEIMLSEFEATNIKNE